MTMPSLRLQGKQNYFSAFHPFNMGVIKIESFLLKAPKTIDQVWSQKLKKVSIKYIQKRLK